jgi:hypothetical protein
MTVVGLFGHIFHAAAKPPYVVRRAITRLVFDRRYRVHTEGRMQAGTLGLPSPTSTTTCRSGTAQPYLACLVDEGA